MDNINPDWVIAIVTGLVTFFGNKLWNRASAKTQQRINSALDEARSIIRQLVLTAAPDTTVEQVKIWAKGVVAIQLAKINLKPSNPIVSGLVNKLIAAAIEEFVVLHPNKTSLKPPILAKLTGGK